MLKKLFIFLIIVIGIIALLHGALFIYINSNGKYILTKSIKNNFDKEASVNSLSLKFPFNIEIKEFESQDFFVKNAKISIGFFNPFTNKLTLNQVYIDGLEAKIVKAKEGIYLDPFFAKPIPKPNRGIVMGQKEKEEMAQDTLAAIEGQPLEQNSSEAAEAPRPKPVRPRLSVVVKDLTIKNSDIQIVYKREMGPVAVVLKNLELKAKDFNYPDFKRFQLDLNTSLSSSLEEAQMANNLNLQGWVDYHNKNMDVDLLIDNFDYLTFSQHYPPFWKPANLNVETAVLSLSSEITSEDNDLTIDNSLALEKIEFIKTKQEEASSKTKTLKTIIDFFKTQDGKSKLNFKLKTKMDSPTLNFSSLETTFNQAFKMAPIAVIGGVVEKVKEKVEDTGKGTVDAVVDTIKGAVESIKDVFTIEEEEIQSEEENTEKENISN